MREQSNISECKSCGAEIVWMKTRNDKNIPVDLPDENDALRDEVLNATLYDKERFKTHFETCPNADKHRGPRTPSVSTSDDSSINAKRLNTALAVLEDIVKQPADGMRAIELAKAGLSQIRAIR